MKNKQKQVFQRSKFFVFTVSILTLSALSFFEIMDEFARVKVWETTVETTGIFAVLRVIDAAVSLLQSVSIGIVDIGSALEPLDHMVERLSNVVAWAVGSLFLQLAILEFVANDFIKYAFLTFGLIALLALSLQTSKRCQTFVCEVFGSSKESMDGLCIWLIKLFFTIAVIRFIVPIFAACSFLFSEALLQPEINKDIAVLTAFSDENQFGSNTSIPSQSRLAEQEQDLKSELNWLRSELTKQHTDLEVIESKSSNPEIDELKTQRQEIQRNIDTTKERITDLERNLKCIDLQIEGKSCDSILDLLNVKEAITQLTEFGDESQFGTDMPIPPQSVLEEQAQDVRTELNALQSELSRYELDLDRIKRKFNDLNEKLKSESEEVQRNIESKKEQIADVEANLECIGRQKEGKSCDSVLDRIKNSKEVVDRILEGAKEVIQSMTRMLILVLAKNILIPLLFAYIAIKFGSPIIKRIMNMKVDFHETAKDIGESLRR